MSDVLQPLPWPVAIYPGICRKALHMSEPHPKHQSTPKWWFFTSDALPIGILGDPNKLWISDCYNSRITTSPAFWLPTLKWPPCPRIVLSLTASFLHATNFYQKSDSVSFLMADSVEHDSGGPFRAVQWGMNAQQVATEQTDESHRPGLCLVFLLMETQE